MIGGFRTGITLVSLMGAATFARRGGCFGRSLRLLRRPPAPSAYACVEDERENTSSSSPISAAQRRYSLAALSSAAEPSIGQSFVECGQMPQCKHPERCRFVCVIEWYTAGGRPRSKTRKPLQASGNRSPSENKE